MKLGLFGPGGLIKCGILWEWEYQDRYGFERWSLMKCVREWMSIPVNRDLTVVGKILRALLR